MISAISDEEMGNGERARLGRSEPRPRGSLLRVKPTRRLGPSQAAIVQRENSAKKHSRIESLNQSRPTTSVSLSSPKGGEGRGEEVVKVQGEGSLTFDVLCSAFDVPRVRGEGERFVPLNDFSEAERVLWSKFPLLRAPSWFLFSK